MYDLIVRLQAILIYCKDAHYAFTGVDFKPLHEWVDEIGEPIYDFMDEIKENSFLFSEVKVPRGTKINEDAAAFVPETLASNIDVLNAMRALLTMTNSMVTDISKQDGITAGESDLLGRIGSHLQKHIGLLNLALK